MNRKLITELLQRAEESPEYGRGVKDLVDLLYEVPLNDVFEVVGELHDELETKQNV